MKKHFLRILTVMLMACLGVGVMAACGDGKEEDPPVTYTVAFSLGSPSHAAEGVTAPASQTGKKVGDTVTLTTLDAAEDWKFDGWSAKSGKVSGTTYTVAAADAVEGTITLTAQWAEDGEPATVEGIWTGIVFEDAAENPQIDGDMLDVEIELTAKLNGDGTKAYAVWKATYEGKLPPDPDEPDAGDSYETYTSYSVKVFTKQGDGSYQITDDGDTYTLTINDQNKLVVTRTVSEGQTKSATAEACAALTTATAPKFTNKQYEKDGAAYTGRVYDFAQNKITLEEGGEEQGMTTINVGAYLFIISEDETFITAVYRDGVLYYTIDPETDESNSLTAAAPTAFEGYVIYYYEGAASRATGMPKADDETKYNVDDDVTVASAPTDPEGRTFKYWIVGEGEDATQVTAGGTYKVKAADKDDWGDSITFTAVWTKLYYVQYISSTEDGQPDDSTTYGDVSTVFSETAFNITDDVPSKPGYTFGGWKLYTKASMMSEELTKVSDTVYKKDDNDHKSYTPTGEESYDTGTLYFVAQWTVNADAEFTVEFSFGTNSHAAGGASVPTVDGTKKANEQVTFADPDAAEGWSFDGWYIGDTKVTSPYTVKAADAGSDGKITITARWKSASDAYTGIWTNAENEEAGTIIISLDADGNKGHGLMIDGFGNMTYFALTKGTDNYTATIMYAPVTFSVAGGKLTMAMDGEPTEYDQYAALGDTIKIPNDAYVADFGTTTFLLTFDTTCSYKKTGLYSTTQGTFEPVYVDKYIIVVCGNDALVIYKSGSDYVAAYEEGQEATLEEPASSTASDYEGVWQLDTTTITVVADEDDETALHVVVKSEGWPEGTFDYEYYKVTAGANGFTSGRFALTFDGTTLHVKGITGVGEYTKTSAVTGSLTLDGTYRGENSSATLTIQFLSEIDSASVTIETTAAEETTEGQGTVVNVGEYVIIALEDGFTTFIIYQDGSKIYATEYNYGTFELTKQGGTPTPTTYDVTFDLNDTDGDVRATGGPENAEDQPAGAYAIPQAEPSREGYDFLGWTTDPDGSGTVYKYGDPENGSVTITDADITLYAKWESNLPTVTVQAGDATGSGDLNFQFVASEDKYNITLPENTVYTAPAGKYFRGYTYAGTTYFPGEQITGIAHKATVEITLVWETLTLNATEPVAYTMLHWFTDGATEVILTEGMTLKFVAKMTAASGTLADWSTIFPDMNMTVGGTNFWLHFRVDKFIATADSNDSNTNDTLKAMIKSSNFNASTYRALYTSDDTAVIHAVTATLKDNKLTYQYDVYASTDTTMENPVCTTVYEAQSSVTIWSLGIKFFYADITSVTEASYTMTTTISANQNPTDSNKLVIGESDKSLGYTELRWTSEIRKGEKFVFAGSQASLGSVNDASTGIELFSLGKVTKHFRVDNAVNGSDSEGAASTAEQWAIARNFVCDGFTDSGNPWTELVALYKEDHTIQFTIDWTNEKEIKIEMKVTGTVADTVKTFTETYTITSTADGQEFAADSYILGLGCLSSYAQLTLTRSHAAAD